MMRRVVRWMLLGFLALPLSGCWDAHPLDDQGIVMSLGIAPSSRPGDLRWTFTFPNVTLSPSSLTSIKPGEQYYNLTVRAPTFAEAVMRVQQQSSRIIYLGQLQAFLWPDTLSWRQLWPVITALNTQGSIPKTYWMIASTSPTQAVTALVSPEVVAPRTFLATYFDCPHCQPFVLGLRGWEFWSHAITPGMSPYAPVIRLDRHKVIIRQILVYPLSGRPVSYSQKETEGFGFLSGKIQRAALSLNWHGNRVSLTQLHDSHHITVRSVPNGIMVDETLKINGFIDQPPPQSAAQPSQDLIQQLAEKRIVAWCLAAIHRANQTQTDPFGYSEPILWNRRQRATFLPIHARITVTVSLKGEGLLR